MDNFYLKESFDKQGGINLIRYYIKERTLFLAILEYLILDKNRTSLEILRLSVEEKIHNKLEKKYIKHLIDFDNNYAEQKHETSNKIWICWFQGIEKAPDIVKKCYESINKTLSNKEIILITKENIFDYVNFPDFIVKKWNKGIITDTHMSDLLRLELLDKYGGLWLDATVFCSTDEKNIPKYLFDSDLFLYQTLKPGRDGTQLYISSWLISAKTNNKIIEATKYMLYEYWKTNNYIDSYYLLHHFMSIILEYYEDDWLKIVPDDNSMPHILLLRLFDKYNENIWNNIKDKIPFHKLTYKLSEEKMMKKARFIQNC